MRASFGAYIGPWEQEFSVGRSLVSSISMLSFLIFAIGQPLAGKLNDRFGRGVVPTAGIFIMGASLLLLSLAVQLWQVFVLFGVVFSLGYAACTSSIPVAIISNWFVKKRGFALGLVMAGFAVGQLILVPANLFFVSSAGWKTTMAVLGVIIMAGVGALFLLLLRSKPEEKGLRPYGYSETSEDILPAGRAAPEGSRSLPLLSVVKMRVFWQLAIPYFICGFTDSGVIQTHLIPIAEGKGLPVSSVALAFILIAIANIAGTILTGHLSDHFSRTRQLAIIYSLRAVTYVFLIALDQPGLLLVFALIYGITEMASIAPTNSLTIQSFEGFSIGAILGLVTVSHHIGGAIGSWIPGLVYDLTGSYYPVLVLAIIMLSCGALIALRIPEKKIGGVKI